MTKSTTPSLIDAARAALKQLAHEVYAVEGRPEEVRNREVRDALRAAIAAEEERERTCYVCEQAIRNLRSKRARVRGTR